jgi:hypothetical protein
MKKYSVAFSISYEIEIEESDESWLNRNNAIEKAGEEFKKDNPTINDFDVEVFEY